MKTDVKTELDGAGEAGGRAGRPEGRDDAGGMLQPPPDKPRAILPM